MKAERPQMSSSSIGCRQPRAGTKRGPGRYDLPGSGWECDESGHGPDIAPAGSGYARVPGALDLATLTIQASANFGFGFGCRCRGLTSPKLACRGSAPAFIGLCPMNPQGLSRPRGGQFSSFMPRVRPRAARTSLISFNDLRPRFGVLSSSFSVRWMRSPM
jgi:hypothetical protein